MASDSELMAQVAAGDTAAFALLVSRHQPWLTNLLYHLFWSREEAEDGAQEVLLRLWLARHSYAPSASLRTYLFTIARNYWHNHSTRIVRKLPAVSLQGEFGERARSVIEHLADLAPTPEQVVLQRYELFRLRRAVDQLPEKQRLVLIMSHFLDMRYGEIAETLQIPEGTVKSRMAAAVQYLRVKLTATGGRDDEL